MEIRKRPFSSNLDSFMLDDEWKYGNKEKVVFKKTLTR